MDTILFFASASRHSCRKRLEGVKRYFRNRDVQVQIVERNYHPVNVRRILDFWHPVGCIAECGSGADELRPGLFTDIPTVFLDEDPKLLTKRRFAVNPDLEGSASLAARELMTLGFEHFGFVGFRLPLFWSKERERVFTDAINLNGHDCSTFSWRGEDSVLRIAELRKWLVALPKPCGIFAAFDETAEEVLAACRQESIDVPSQVAVLSVDNDEEICESTKPTLSSICPDFEKAGYLCAELLDIQLADRSAKPETRSYGIIGIVRRKSTLIFKRKDSKVTDAIEYIRLNACDRITVADVVERMGCSRRTAEMRFKDLTGRSIQEEIRSVRMSNAIALLRKPNQSIDGIANLCGYESDSTLRYAFKALTGMSMREWRKKEGI